MRNRLIPSFVYAFQSIRTNLFHTILSVLGIVIGVAALVCILALIDGLEKFARDEVGKTTNLNAVVIETQTESTENHLLIKKAHFRTIDLPEFMQLMHQTQDLRAPYGHSNLTSEFNARFTDPATKQSLAAEFHAQALIHFPDTLLLAGKLPDESGMQILVNRILAQQLDSSMQTVMEKTIQLGDHNLKIAGILKSKPKEFAPIAILPLQVLSTEECQQNPPTAVLEAATIEQVSPLKTKTQAWIRQQFGKDSSDFKVFSNDYRVAQLSQGFSLFRMVMGIIVGISVLVGGVGVMNVLLISVTERTAEIGLRKALGARKRDIMQLFLCESITISAFGSALGLLGGVLAGMVITPILHFFSSVPFHAVYTWNTFALISGIALLVGVCFGTYPALKAARLDPVEAIRRE